LHYTKKSIVAIRITGETARWLMASAAFAVGSVTASAAQETLYRLIGSRADGRGSTKAYARNNTGRIVGWMESGADRHGAHWHVDTTTDLHGTVYSALAHP
jgi:hypothetical protein